MGNFRLFAPFRGINRDRILIDQLYARTRQEHPFYFAPLYPVVDILNRYAQFIGKGLLSYPDGSV